MNNLHEILKDLKYRGFKVKKYKGRIFGRKAFYINNKLMTDYELLDNYTRIGHYGYPPAWDLYSGYGWGNTGHWSADRGNYGYGRLYGRRW